MQFTLNRRSTVPMYRQLAAELREQIVSGAMAEGYRLPPERELASRLEVNRTTVLQAYQQLKDEGLIASKVGKGTFVLPLQHIETARIPVVRHEPIDEEPKPSVVRPPWSVLFSDYSNRFTYHDIASAERAQRGDTIIDFATGSPNPADIPDDLLRSVSIEAFESREFDGQPESPIEGFDELRALLAEHMSTRGVQCDVRNVMVLSGSEQGIDLIVRAFVNPGDCVLVEQSTFFPALQTFRSADARIIGVPVDEHGMRTDLLDGYCARFRPKLIYTVPTFQNPTGTTLPPERRSELIDVARRYQCLIVEDDAYGDLWYGGESSDAHRPIPLKGMENAGYVMYLSTFSKTVTSGLRTGWVVADPHVINRLAALRRMVDQHTSTSSQRICLELLKEGRVAEHLRGLIKAYRIQDKARNVGFDWEERSQVWSKVKEEIGEFEAEVENMDKEKAEAEFGDVMFSLINAARLYKINPDNALEHTNQKFIRRFNYLEEHTIKQGKELKDMTLEEMDAIWNEAKSTGL